MKRKSEYGTDVREHARLGEKISFGFASASYSCEMAVANAYFMLFCTDVMGLSAGAVGVLFLVGKIVDALTDILVTNIADKTMTPWGKYRPWILMGIPMAISFVAMYWYPSFLQTDTAKLIWVYVFYLVTISGFETAITCPMQVMCTSVSQYDRDRVHFVTAKSLGESSGDLICSALIMPIVLMFGSYQNITGWRWAVLAMGAIIILCSGMGFAGTKERILHTSVNEDGELLTFREKLQALKGNAPFYKLIAVTLGINLLWIFSMSLSSYYCIYVIGHEEWISPVYMAATVAQLLATCSVPLLTVRLPKRWVLIGGAGFTVLSGLACAVTMGLFGTMFYAALRGIGIGLLMASLWSLWPDVTDYTESVKGRAVPGIVMAFANFSTKIGIGAASYLATFCLNWFRYDAAAPAQSDFFLRGLHGSLVVVPILFGLLIIAVTVSLKELSSGRMEEIRQELFEKRK